MAEYSMTYADAKSFVSDCINNSPTPENLEPHKVEILAALTMRTADIGDNISGELRESLELWENQVGNPSKLLLGTRYFSVKSSVIKLVESMITSGLMDLVISNIQAKVPNPMYGMTIGVGSAVVLGLADIFKSASELQDHDFCVYMQAVTHFHEHKRFQKSDLLEWFPHGEKKECNMHNSKWECEYYMDDDSCSMLKLDNLDKALKSLEEKKLIKPEHENRQYYYSFV